MNKTPPELIDDGIHEEILAHKKGCADAMRSVEVHENALERLQWTANCEHNRAYQDQGWLICPECGFRVKQ